MLEILEQTSEKNRSKLTYLSAKGTYLTGPPFGQKIPLKNQALFAVIIEGKRATSL